MLPDLAESRQSSQKVLPEMAKSRQRGQKVPKMEKKGFMGYPWVSRKCYVFELQGSAPFACRARAGGAQLRALRALS